MAYRDDAPICGWCRKPIEARAQTFGEGHLHWACETEVTAMFTARVKSQFTGARRCPECGDWRRRLLALAAKAGLWACALALAVSMVFYLGTCVTSCGTRTHCYITEEKYEGSSWMTPPANRFVLWGYRLDTNNEPIGHFATIDEALKAAEAMKCPIK